MKRFTYEVSDDRLKTAIYDRKNDVTYTILNYQDAWELALPKDSRRHVCTMIRLGWYQRRHRLLP